MQTIYCRLLSSIGFERPDLLPPSSNISDIVPPIPLNPTKTFFNGSVLIFKLYLLQLYNYFIHNNMNSKASS